MSGLSVGAIVGSPGWIALKSGVSLPTTVTIQGVCVGPGVAVMITSKTCTTGSPSAVIWLDCHQVMTSRATPTEMAIFRITNTIKARLFIGLAPLRIHSPPASLPPL